MILKLFKLVKLLKIIIVNKTKFIIQKPLNKKYVIFDKVGSENFIDLFEQSNTYILNTRFESINIRVLIYCILELDVSLLNYYSKYIEIINPKIVITYIDNRILFYQLKKKINGHSIKFISVQNGTRRSKNDIFDDLKNYKDLESDIYFVWGENIARELSKYIKSEYVMLGSYKNNKRKILKSKKLKIINFISQYRNNNTWKKFGNDYFIENKLLPTIWDFCKKNNFILRILCTSSSLNEKNYFLNIIKKNENIEFAFRENSYDNYHKLDQGKLNIFIDSTMGYESLARGNKTIAFSLRLKNIEESFKFGWPNYKTFESKNYVMKTLNKVKVFERLSKILNQSDESWKNEIEEFKIIMNYNKNNKILINKINKIK